MDNIAYTPIFQCPAVANCSVQPQYQRRWLLVDSNNSLLENQAEKQMMMSIEIKFSYLLIRAPGMLRLDIPLDVLEDDEDAFEFVSIAGERKRAVSEGDLVAQWLTVYFHQDVRLMKLHIDEMLG